MRVATWNIWWRHGDWKARQASIASTLVDLDADIVALQEVCSDEPDQPAWLSSELGYNVAVSPDGNSDRHGLVNAIATRWPIDHVCWEYLDVGELPPHRTVLHCRLDTPFGHVDAYCTHLSHGFDQSRLRQRQVAQIMALVAQGRTDPANQFPPILLGDLNAVPASDEIRQLTGLSPAPVDGLVFTDAWAMSRSDTGATYSDTNPHVRDSAWPERRLDYVLVGWPRRRPLGNPVDAELFGLEPRGGTVGSDHYGVVVDLQT